MYFNAVIHRKFQVFKKYIRKYLENKRFYRGLRPKINILKTLKLFTER